MSTSRIDRLAGKPEALAESAAARADLQNVLDGLLSGREGLRVLDAGCGGAMRVRLPRDIQLRGIDISPDSAARNRTISDIVIGDVQTYAFPPKSFDIILCWELLEHVAEPRRALARFFDALDENGILIVAIPNPASLKGLITKFTPHAFQVWVLRTFLKHRNAGRPGYAPFPAFLSWTLTPKALLDYARAKGMETVYFRAYAGTRIDALKRSFPPGYWAYAALARALNLASLGAWDFRQSDMLLVLRRRTAETVT